MDPGSISSLLKDVGVSTGLLVMSALALWKTVGKLVPAGVDLIKAHVDLVRSLQKRLAASEVREEELIKKVDGLRDAVARMERDK